MTDPQGTPIWFEHSSDDPVKAKAFYEALAHWTVGDPLGPEMGDYRLAAASDGRQVAGLMATPEDMDGLPGWALYFAADDVDALAARIEQLGGALHFGPHDIPGVGRFATVADPQGVAFHVMRGISDEASTAFGTTDGGDLGHGVWIELATPDPDGAFAFYGALFGWTKAGAMPMGEMGEYAFIGANGQPCPGGSQQVTGPGAVMSSTATGAPARWNWYIHVPDIDAAIATATGRGATLTQGPDEIPGGDFSANLTDDQGHPIGIVGPRRQES